MARRLSAMIAILIILGLALVLMWRVYLHHNQIQISDDESSSIVRLSPIKASFSL